MRLVYICHVVFIICSCSRRNIRICSGSPLDPALHRNPFQYIDYDIDLKPQAKKGVQPLMSAKTGPAPKGVKPLMGMNTRPGTSSEQKITDIASLVATMDKAAAEVRLLGTPDNRMPNHLKHCILQTSNIRSPCLCLLLYMGNEINPKVF